MATVLENEGLLLRKSWRLEHLYYIKDKQANKVSFKPNRAQDDFLEKAGNRNIILKSRQLGFTTLEVIDMLDDVLFTPNYNALLISYDRLSSLDIFDSKVNYAWENIDPYLKKLYKIDTDTKNTIKFDFGDGTFSQLSVRTSGRSGTFNRLHVSEMGKIALKYPDKVKEIITGSLPAVPLTGRADIESTAEGSSGEFYDLFMEAWGRPVEYPTQFKAFFYSWIWDDHEMRQIEKVVPDEKLPREMVDYKKENDLTQLQITYYYFKWLALNKNWSRLRQEYPTTPKEAFEGAIEGAYYIDHMKAAEEGDRVKEVPYEPNLPVFTAWDLGRDDQMVIIFFQLFQQEIRIIDVIAGCGEPVSHYLDKMKEKNYDNYSHCYVPWDARIKNVTNNKSALDVFYEKGFSAVLVPNLSVIDGINAVRDNFHRLYFDKNNTEPLRSALRIYRKQWDDKFGKFKDTPFHGPESDYADAMRYCILSITNFEPQKEKEWYDIGPGTTHKKASESDFDVEFGDENNKYEPIIKFEYNG